MADLIGKRLGQYEIISLLGEGGMATVYRARQSLAGRVQREVAIKVIESRLAQRDEFVARFEREAQTIISLSHAHILKVFDYGQQEDVIYLVMELLSGGSLAERIRRGALPLDTTVRLLDQIADALDFAHSKGIVHRDLKPQNVLLDESGNAFLSDFGIVKLLDETSGLTQSGVAVGTPAYMAPEQWQAGTVDARSDIYSLGVMLFEMLSGHVPFQADTPFHMMHMHIYEPSPSAHGLRPELPPNVDRVLDRALAKNPIDRYQSAGALAKAFKDSLTATGTPVPILQTATAIDVTPSRSQQPTQPAVPAAPSRRRIPVGIIALFAVVVLASLLIGFVANRGGISSTPTLDTITANVQIAALPTSTSSATASATNIPSAPPILPSATPTIVLSTRAPTSTPTVSPPPPTDTVAPSSTVAPILPSATRTSPATNTPIPPTVLPSNTLLPPPTTLAPTFTLSPPPTLLPTLVITATRAPGDTRVDSKSVMGVYVPAGCFMMGSEGNDKDEVPVHKVCITKPFWLDQTEVSNALFDQYLAATGKVAGKALPTGFDSPTQPRVNVSWMEASSYAKWRGCRLPTEAEWEWASRGPQDSIWPWGNDQTPTKAQTAELKPDRTADVMSFVIGKSWVNAYQMAGNVWEWLNDWYDEKYYTISPTNDPQGPTSARQFRVLRGGSFRQDLLAARGSDRYWAPPEGRADFVGFRVACSLG